MLSEIKPSSYVSWRRNFIEVGIISATKFLTGTLYNVLDHSAACSSSTL